MDGTEVSVLEEGHQISLGRLLEGQHSEGLESKVGLVILGDFADEALEGQLSNEKLGGLLVPTDLAECHCARTIPMRRAEEGGSASNALKVCTEMAMPVRGVIGVV